MSSLQMKMQMALAATMVPQNNGVTVGDPFLPLSMPPLRGNRIPRRKVGVKGKKQSRRAKKLNRRSSRKK